ncbi:ABC transporter ATP-binding protein [Ornithinimicrobium sp. INDO-MA30-4]|uniref:ABC transporter ATP-binding protein n=1 Tax=Ornithinimicrobium sp. INDO-MA30-4 TaxID=2908651 RepID=UPI001F459495|nr:ABC transporter ATP-binding protein [Ornithinimicrobium sp. INDO-MA30-4]UJH69545.1 ABC transporter ATP-binding protein [Ornithinimicrobium sp. INDO-MA30-4]
MIRAEDVSWSYGDSLTIDGVSLEARPGRVLGLIGPNGSGKTTLLRLLYGALKTKTGHIAIDDTDLRSMSAKATAQNLAVVVQESVGETVMTVSEMVMLGRLPHLSTFQRASDHDEGIVADCLDRVGALHLASRSFAGLSGGERQRVLIARALAQEATHLLLDEPTNHLDIRYQHEVLSIVRALDTTTIVVLHDLNLAARYCDDLVLLRPGSVAAAGPTSQVLDPQTLTEVYGIGVERVESGGHLHLLFEPLRPAMAEAKQP